MDSSWLPGLAMVGSAMGPQVSYCGYRGLEAGVRGIPGSQEPCSPPPPPALTPQCKGLSMGSISPTLFPAVGEGKGLILGLWPYPPHPASPTGQRLQAGHCGDASGGWENFLTEKHEWEEPPSAFLTLLTAVGPMPFRAGAGPLGRGWSEGMGQGPIARFVSPGEAK